MSLQPLSDDIPDEARKLSDELRRFFTSLNVSVRRYAARQNYDPATVSRYLNGKRVPPWPFIHSLLSEVAEHFGTPVQQDAYEVIRKLHRAALEKSNKQRYAVQSLQDKLAEADKEHKLAETREMVLLEAMRVRQNRIAQLENDALQINSSLLEERNRSENLQNQIAQLLPGQDELTRLREEVCELKEQLARAQELSTQSETRCQELEEQLQAAEETAQSGEEAREQEKLQAALQEAAEAQAQADSLREQLERLQQALGVQPHSPSARKTPRTPRRKEDGRKSFVERIASEPVDKIAASLMKMNIRDDGANTHMTMREMGSTYPIQKIGELVIECDKLSETLSRTILMGFGETRKPEDILQLVAEFGSAPIHSGSTVASQVLTWFSWDRPVPDITQMVKLLRETGWPELANKCLQIAAQHQPSAHFAQLINDAADDRDAVLDYAADYRTSERIIPLIARMDGLNGESVLTDLLERLEQKHPSKYAEVRIRMEKIGLLAD